MLNDTHDSAIDGFITEVGEDALDFRSFGRAETPIGTSRTAQGTPGAGVANTNNTAIASTAAAAASKAGPKVGSSSSNNHNNNSSSAEGPGRQDVGSQPGTPGPMGEAYEALPLTVQEVLWRKRSGAKRVPSLAMSQAGATQLAATLLPQRQQQRTQPIPAECDTEKMRLFCSSVQLLKEQTNSGFSSHLEAKTFVNLAGYSLDGIAEKKRHNPGSLQLIYMFYSRIYEKLVGKQKGVEVNLFAPIDLEARCLGFRAILDFVKDFKLCPGKVGRRELERMYCTVHPGPMPPLERFASKITYQEFLRLIAMIDCGGEPMDRSKLDGTRIRCNESRLETTKRLAHYMSITNCKKVKVILHDAYRDVHFWRLSDGSDFEKEARACEMRSRPQWSVLPMKPLKPSEQAKENGIVKYLSEKFTWQKMDKIWEEYEAPFLDMGTSVAGGPQSQFKMTLTNRGLALARLQLKVMSGGPLRLPWRDAQLGPGESIDVFVHSVPLDCGEWLGEIVATASWVGAFSDAPEELHIPTYMRVVHPRAGSAHIASQLPLMISRPFEPGSNCRLILDPAPLYPRQLQTPTPGASRPGSVCTTTATTPCQTVTPYTALSGRALSSGRAATASGLRSGSRPSSSRPASGGVRGVCLAKEVQRDRSASVGGVPNVHAQSHGHGRGRGQQEMAAGVQGNSSSGFFNTNARAREGSSSSNTANGGQQHQVRPQGCAQQAQAARGEDDDSSLPRPFSAPFGTAEVGGAGRPETPAQQTAPLGPSRGGWMASPGGARASVPGMRPLSGTRGGSARHPFSGSSGPMSTGFDATASPRSVASAWHPLSDETRHAARVV